MNILEQAKNEKFVKEQFIKGRILDDTKDYGRTQFVDEIYKLQQENKQLKDNWNKLREYFNERIEVCDNRLSTPFCNFEKTTKERLIFSQCLEKLEELQGSDSNE